MTSLKYKKKSACLLHVMYWFCVTEKAQSQSIVVRGNGRWCVCCLVTVPWVMDYHVCEWKVL